MINHRQRKALLVLERFEKEVRAIYEKKHKLTTLANWLLSDKARNLKKRWIEFAFEVRGIDPYHIGDLPENWLLLCAEKNMHPRSTFEDIFL